MDKVAQEIESMTTDQETLPLGQKILRAGFKRLTMADLQARFALDAVNRRLDEEMVAAYPLPDNIDPKRVIARRITRTYREAPPDFAADLAPAGGWFQRAQTIKVSIPRGASGFRRARVCIDPLESYIGDVIPDRVYSSMAKAIALGFKRDLFAVAYPVIEAVQLKDPILVYPWPTATNPDQYLENDMWE
jgi:hypothetical protein